MTPLRNSRLRVLAAVAAATTWLASQTAVAHPHIWVAAEATLLFDNGTVTGIRHRWLFDEYYSTMAIQGLDTNNDGIYDRKELTELAQVNIDGLKEMGFFTNAKLGGQDLTFGAPQDYWLEHVEVVDAPGPASQIEDQTKLEDQKKPGDKPGVWSRLKDKLATKPAAPPKPMVLALEFTLPLAKPVLAEADGFTFSVYDPEMMIWFEYAKASNVKLSQNAPKGCSVDVAAPKDQPDLQSLSEAMASQLGGAAGASMAKTVTLKCPKS
jgi:ABC-type uncharacterized transport system substrate-binding protein